jgi:hypothetical protein
VKRSLILVISLVGIFWYSGCSSPKIITYAHASADFERYQTFRIKPHKEIEAISRKGHETYQRLDTLIASQLKSRGYQYSIDPDLIIEYEISTGLSQQTPSQNYQRYPYSWYYPDYSYSGRPQDIDAMIEIEMVDSGSKKTVWTGSTDFTMRTRRDDNVARMEEHIIEIFERFEYTAP